MDSIKLEDNQWRDDNLSSMEDWHPGFNRVSPRLRALVSEFESSMKEYKGVLLADQEQADYDGLYRHVCEEVMQWLGDRLDDSVAEVWSGGDRPLDTHQPPSVILPTVN